MSIIYIYGLFDPRNLELRYIGKAKDIKDRLRNHIRLANDPRFIHHHNYRWIRQLLNEDLEPAIEILEECTQENWREIEQIWIAECRKFNVRLTNMTKGGDSFPDGYIPYNKGGTIPEHQKEALRQANIGKKVSDETKRKLRESHLGKKLPEEQRKKISESNKGKVMSLEARQKISLARKGKVIISSEQKQRISESHKGKTLSEEHKRKISLGSKHQRMTEENKEKLRLANTGRKVSDEQRKQMSERNTGKKLTDEHKKKISIGIRKFWAMRKELINN